jgi:hypothetical protein
MAKVLGTGWVVDVKFIPGEWDYSFAGPYEDKRDADIEAMFQFNQKRALDYNVRAVDMWIEE